MPRRAHWAILGLALLPLSAGAQDVSYTVVVNASNPVTRLTQDQVSRIFLRKLTMWESKKPILPVDQTADAPVRRTFTKRIHQRTIAAVQTFWQQQTFAGIAVAPPERGSDADVLNYIRKYPDAIGYVRAGVPLGPAVKALNVLP
jgi:ABC-type phosphate transport system substrate-binding protein